MSEVINPKSQIVFIGLGRGGIRTLNLLEKHKDADYVICDTDNFHLNKSNVENKILLTYDLNSISQDSLNNFEKLMENRYIVFFVCSLGGKTGLETLPKLLAICKKLNKKTICILSKPFQFEGVNKQKISNDSEIAIRKLATSTVVLENEMCQTLFPDFNLSNAFHFSHRLLAQNCNYFEKIIFTPGVLSIDISDLLTVLRDSEKTVICDGRSSKPNRLYDAFQNACTHPAINSFHIDQFDKMLLHYNCPKSDTITMKEIEQDFFRIIALLPNTSIPWTFCIDEELVEGVDLILIASKSNKAVKHLLS